MSATTIERRSLWGIAIVGVLRLAAPSRNSGHDLSVFEGRVTRTSG
jgi:hypothetical protein